MIASHSAGPLTIATPIYGTLNGTYTAPSTGIYQLEIYNYRTDIQKDLQNYIDDITLVPTSTDFICDLNQASANVYNTFTFTLNAGSSWAGWKYWVFTSATGGWPGLTNNGIWVPLVFDNLLQLSIQYANVGAFVHTRGTLDSFGQSWCQLVPANILGSPWVGRSAHVAYVLYAGPSISPISYASQPVEIYFVP